MRLGGRTWYVVNMFFIGERGEKGRVWAKNAQKGAGLEQGKWRSRMCAFQYLNSGEQGLGDTYGTRLEDVIGHWGVAKNLKNDC